MKVDWLKHLKGRCHLEDLCIVRKLMLELILGKCVKGILDSSGLYWRPQAGCECDKKAGRLLTSCLIITVSRHILT
jgi:hypothetical protein